MARPACSQSKNIGAELCAFTKSTGSGSPERNNDACEASVMPLANENKIPLSIYF